MPTLKAVPAPLSCRRADFSLPPNTHYLNCAYMSPLSKRVQEAGARGLLKEARPDTITGDDFFDGPNRVRALFAELIGLAEPARVAVIPSVSYALATVARNTMLKAGQNVVTAEGQFPSNVHPWTRICRAADATLRVVAPPVSGPGRTEAWNGALLEAIDADTALVAVGSVHWTDGTPFDVEAIGNRAREVGAAFVVDGTQSVGAVPFDVGRVRPDALVCAGYKWLTGPYSIGVACYGSRYDGGTPLEETWAARAGSDDFTGLVDQPDEYRPGAARYEVGEAAAFVLIPMLSAALEQVLEWSVKRIGDYIGALTQSLVHDSRVEAMDLEVLGSERAHLFGVRLPQDADPRQIATRLADRGVFVSVRGRTIRVSPHVYNDPGDIEALLVGLEAAGVAHGG